MAASEALTGTGSTIHPDDLLDVLDRVLARTSAATIRAMVESARIRRYAIDDPIFVQGEEVPLTYLHRGFAAYRRTTDDGRQVIVGVARPGDIVGFTSIARLHSSFELVALTECEGVTWRGPDIRHWAAADSGFAIDAIDRMAAFLMTTTAKFDGFLHQDARRRVMRILERHQDLLFADPAIITRAQLPSLVGTTREMTGRVLRELERDGTLVRVGRTGLRLLRPDRLQAESEAPPA